jgi:CheY-like chemotaxis protein
MRPSALIVEDEAVCLTMMVGLVESEGFAVDVAVDGAQAIELLSRRDYDVIILDIILPKVSGIDVMDYLRQTRPAALERIIVVTGVDVKEIQRLYPVFQAIGKPVLPSRLRSWVRKCLEGEPARQAVAPS